MLNKHQCVCVRGCFSEWSKIISEVPQGSVLGPVLFIIYVNDLPDNVMSLCTYMFADDTKLYRTIDSDLHITCLQNDLNYHRIGVKPGRQMDFNIEKCKVMSLQNTTLTFVYAMSST